jgi:hypothetical protein
VTTDEFEFETTIDEALVNRLRQNPKWVPVADGAYVEFTKIEMIECTPTAAISGGSSLGSPTGGPE